MKSFGLNKHEKLKGVKPINLLFKKHEIETAFPIKAVFSCKSRKNDNIRIGFTVSKRKINKASGRNKIKRKLRETFRLNKSLLLSKEKQSSETLIMFIYLGDGSTSTIKLNESMKKLLQKINKKIIC